MRSQGSLLLVVVHNRDYTLCIGDGGIRRTGQVDDERLVRLVQRMILNRCMNTAMVDIGRKGIR